MQKSRIAIAIRVTPIYAKSAGWDTRLSEVCSFLGFNSNYPSISSFVNSVADWQKSHGPLAVDGILGPNTWAKMRSLMGAQAKKSAPIGPHPEWISKVNPQAYAPARNTGGPVITAPAAGNSEDKIIQEMVHVVMEQKADAYVAVAVSGEYAARQGFPSGVKSDFTGQPISQILAVGQQWQGIAGPRIIVGLSGGGSMGSVIFITDSGQAYDQGVIGWESDMYAKLWSDVSQKMAPMKTLLESEAAFLLGVVAATSPYAAGLVFTGSVTQFMLLHKEDMPKAIFAFGELAAIRTVLKSVAPTLYSKVIDIALGKILAEIPASASTNPVVIARFAGGVIAKIGFGRWNALLDPKLLFTVGTALKKVFGEAFVAGLRAIPGAVKQATSSEDLVAKLKDIGSSVTIHEAEMIKDEVAASQEIVMRQFQKIADLGSLYGNN